MKRLAILLALAGVAADAPYQSSPQRRIAASTRDWGPWAGPFRTKLLGVMAEDFGERYLYADADARLPLPARNERRVVFMGDSITDGWNLAQAFPGRPYVNRGIGAQVTAQMLVRFQQDVVALRPAAVVILGGTNDLTGMLQVETPQTILANIEAMTDIARAHGIRVVLASLLPVSNYPHNTDYLPKERPLATLRALNVGLRALARRRGYIYADYATPLTDARGMLDARYSNDGLHPNAAGYAVMQPVAAKAVAEALAR